MLDVSCYQRTRDGFVFSLGGGLTLDVPGIIEQRMQRLTWAGVTFKAGPPELAFLPKAVSLTSGRARPQDRDDVERMKKLIDRGFLRELLARGAVRWRGRPLPVGLQPFRSERIWEVLGD